jgi:hypothetical protein
MKRIADYGANVADLNKVSLEEPVGLIIMMAEVAQHMLQSFMSVDTENIKT